MTRSDIFADPDELLFAAESEHYDLAFIDIELGDQSGIRLSNHLLRIHPDIQIIFFSGYDDYYLDVYNVESAYIFSRKKPVDPGASENCTVCSAAQDPVPKRQIPDDFQLARGISHPASGDPLPGKEPQADPDPYSRW